MRYYKSKSYESMYPGMFASNLFLVMDATERFNLESHIEKLLEDIEDQLESGKLVRHLTKTGALAKKGKGTDPTKKYWNAKDDEAIVFLKRMCWYTVYPESEAIDPTIYQLQTIVEKMLTKIYGMHYGQFINWMKLWHDTQGMDATDMRDHMQAKRDLIKSLKVEGMLPQEFRLP